MENMLNKYNSLVESDRFRAPTEVERRIVALKAAIKNIKNDNVKLGSKLNKQKINNNKENLNPNARGNGSKKPFNKD